MLYCPSIMCADFNNLQQEIRNLDIAGADIFHLDIMDGHFVPNFGLGLQDIKAIRENTTKLIDVHLMISNPSEYIDTFAELGADIIYVHPESDIQITSTLQKIKDKNKKAGIAINPGTSFSQVEELLPLVEYVMIMTVNPGFSGQPYLDFVEEKIRKFTKFKIDYGYEVLIDGAVSNDVIKNLSKYNVDGFVLGTSALFNQPQSYKEIFDSFHNKKEVNSR